MKWICSSWTPALTYPRAAFCDSLSQVKNWEGDLVKQQSLFGLSEHLEKLSEHGDPLEVLDATVDFEYFRGWLVEGLGYSDGAKGGVHRLIPCRCSRL